MQTTGHGEGEQWSQGLTSSTDHVRGQYLFETLLRYLRQFVLFLHTAYPDCYTRFLQESQRIEEVEEYLAGEDNGILQGCYS